MCEGQEGDTGPPRDDRLDTALIASPENAWRFPATSRYKKDTAIKKRLR
jgi:hypothetical protein